MPGIDELTGTTTRTAGPEFHTESLLLELQDERERARRREAVFLSIIAHLCLLILIIVNPKIFRSKSGTPLGPLDLLKRNQVTYLEMPENTPKPPKPVHSNVLSDRDRLFHRHEPVTDSLNAPRSLPAPPPRPSTKAANRAPVVAPPPQPAPQPAAPKPTEVVKAAPPKTGIELQDVKPAQEPKVQVPIGQMSVTSQLQKAMQEAARQRVEGGQSGVSVGRLPGAAGQVPKTLGQGVGQTGTGYRILTDTQGVDFDPYMRRVIAVTKQNWYAVMPEVVYMGQKGRVMIRFKILRSGSVTSMQLIGGSGTASLDRAALAAISTSNPYPPLPPQFTGPEIDLEFWFLYNLTPAEAQ